MAPVITGKQLIRLLRRDGWIIRRQARHGFSLSKSFGDRTKVTVVPNTRAVLPIGTLMDILGPKQTGIGRQGLSDLIDKFGV
jgi:predicted RNA binding protein YcfA (HicA-like mRNA interferase family)